MKGRQQAFVCPAEDVVATSDPVSFRIDHSACKPRRFFPSERDEQGIDIEDQLEHLRLVYCSFRCHWKAFASVKSIQLGATYLFACSLSMTSIYFAVAETFFSGKFQITYFPLYELKQTLESLAMRISVAAVILVADPQVRMSNLTSTLVLTG